MPAGPVELNWGCRLAQGTPVVLARCGGSGGPKGTTPPALLHSDLPSGWPLLTVVSTQSSTQTALSARASMAAAPFQTGQWVGEPAGAPLSGVWAGIAGHEADILVARCVQGGGASQRPLSAPKAPRQLQRVQLRAAAQPAQRPAAALAAPAGGAAPAAPPPPAQSGLQMPAPASPRQPARCRCLKSSQLWSTAP